MVKLELFPKIEMKNPDNDEFRPMKFARRAEKNIT